MKRRFPRAWPAAALTAGLLVGGAPSALACQACFGAEDSPLIDGARLGALVLVLVTLAVQGGFAAFFIYLRRRARTASRLELDVEWTEFQKTSRVRS